MNLSLSHLVYDAMGVKNTLRKSSMLSSSFGVILACSDVEVENIFTGNSVSESDIIEEEGLFIGDLRDN